MPVLDISNLADNLAEGPHNNKCKDCKSCIECIKLKDKLLIFNCSGCKKNYKKDFNEDLTKRYANTYKFCCGDINKNSLMLRKGVYPYKYINV